MRRASTSLRPLVVPPRERVALENGLTLHLVPRGPLPLVAVRVVLQGGSARDRAGRAGLADFAARLMRRGAGRKSADEISEAVDFVGAALGCYATEENVVLSLTCPTRHLAPMLELLAQVLTAPEFPDAEVELARRRTLAQIQNDLDDPGAIADKAIAKALWGTHPYGHEQFGQKRSIEAVTRAEVVDFHRTRLGPAGGHVYVVGVFDRSAVVSFAERVFGGWRGATVPLEPIAPWAGPVQPGSVVIIDKPEQTQAQLRVGARGVKRGHPDHFPLTVMNAVLGGGFTSRLISEIRVKRGLSYGANSAFDHFSVAGTLQLSSFTKTARVAELVNVALGEVKKMRAKGPTPVETETMKRYVAGLYPSRIETNESLASVLADVQHFGLGDDWVSSYRARIAAVTPAAVAAAARAHLFQDERVIALVGDAAALEPKVSKFGPVTVLGLNELE